MKLKKSLSLLLAGGLAASIFLTGCNAKSNSEAKDGAKVIKIATQTPLSGGSATVGDAIKLGAQMKLDEEKKKFKDMGFDLKLVPYDDQGDPKKGVANANIIGADKSILAVVGHFNSGVAIPSSEVYNKYDIPMVSPANSAVEVTSRGLKVVNRICSRDDYQGPAGAAFSVDTLGAKKIFIIQDKTAYGTGLAEAFKKGAEDKGAEVVGFEGITVGEKDFNGVLNQVVSKKPDLIFFGGIYSEGGLIIKQAREKGFTGPIVGGDGMDASTLVEIAGEAVKNVYITSLAGDTTKSETGKKFIESYKAKFNKSPESYSIYGYDSMGVVLKGIEDAYKANGDKLPARAQVRDAIRAVKDYEGAMTKVSFDDIGDNDYAKVYIYSFKEAKYPAELVGEVGK